MAKYTVDAKITTEVDTSVKHELNLLHSSDQILPVHDFAIFSEK